MSLGVSIHFSFCQKLVEKHCDNILPCNKGILPNRIQWWGNQSIGFPFLSGFKLHAPPGIPQHKPSPALHHVSLAVPWQKLNLAWNHTEAVLRWMLCKMYVDFNYGFPIKLGEMKPSKFFYHWHLVTVNISSQGNYCTSYLMSWHRCFQSNTYCKRSLELTLKKDLYAVENVHTCACVSVCVLVWACTFCAFTYVLVRAYFKACQIISNALDKDPTRSTHPSKRLQQCSVI